MELSDLFTGKVSPRKMLNYIRALPPDSAYGKKRYGEVVLWTPELHRLTDIFDALAIANWQRTGDSRHRPSPVTRPEFQVEEVPSAQPKSIPEKETVLGPDDLNALFDRLESRAQEE